MQILVHFKKDNLESLLLELIEIKDLYTKEKFGLESSFTDLLIKAENFFEQIGQTAYCSKISSLRTYLFTAQSGINPVSLERIVKYKRNIVSASLYYGLSGLSEILESELIKTNEILHSAEQKLYQFILSLAQSNIVHLDQLSTLQDTDEIEIYWEHLLDQDEQVSIINQQILQNIHSKDLILLLEQLIKEKFKTIHHVT